MISSAAVEQLSRFAREAEDGSETGGIVLGFDGGLAGDFTVLHCGDAGPNAVRRRDYFLRDVAHAQALAETAAIQDGSVWIGEWHTHLVDLNRPSDTDLRTYRRLLDDPEVAFTRVLSLIVLRHPVHGWERPLLHAWSFTGTLLRGLPITATEGTENVL